MRQEGPWPGEGSRGEGIGGGPGAGKGLEAEETAGKFPLQAKESHLGEGRGDGRVGGPSWALGWELTPDPGE